MTPDFAISACEDVLLEFEALDPKGLLDAVHEELEAEGMLRTGDEERHRALRDWFEERLTRLPAELEDNREPPLVAPIRWIAAATATISRTAETTASLRRFLEAAGGAGGADGAGGNVGEAGSDGGGLPAARGVPRSRLSAVERSATR